MGFKYKSESVYAEAFRMIPMAASPSRRGLPMRESGFSPSRRGLPMCESGFSPSRRGLPVCETPQAQSAALLASLSGRERELSSVREERSALHREVDELRQRCARLQASSEGLSESERRVTALSAALQRAEADRDAARQLEGVQAVLERRLESAEREAASAARALEQATAESRRAQREAQLERDQLRTTCEALGHKCEGLVAELDAAEMQLERQRLQHESSAEESRRAAAAEAAGLRKQLAPAQRAQAGYEALSTQLRETTRRLEALERERDELRLARDTSAAEGRASSEACELAENERRRLAERVVTLETDLATATRDASEQRAQHRQRIDQVSDGARMRLAEAERVCDDASATASSLEATNAALEARAAEASAEARAAEKRASLWETAATRAQRRLAEAEATATRERDVLEEQIASIRAELVEAHESAAAARDAARAQLEVNERLRGDADELRAQLARHDERLREASDQIERHVSAAQAAATASVTSDAKLAAASAEVEGTKAHLVSARAAAMRLEPQLRSMEQQKEEAREAAKAANDRAYFAEREAASAGEQLLLERSRALQTEARLREYLDDKRRMEEMIEYLQRRGKGGQLGSRGGGASRSPPSHVPYHQQVHEDRAVRIAERTARMRHCGRAARIWSP